MATANANHGPGSPRERRQAAGLTQEEVARQVGCSVAFVRLCEGGWRPGDPDASPVFARLQTMLAHVDEPPAPANAPKAQKAVTAAHDAG